MIVEYIRYRIPVEGAEAFEAAYLRAGKALDASSHCRGYELCRCVEEPEQYILRIEWDSVEGHLNGFRQSPEFRAFFAEVRPYVGQISEMRHYQRTDVASTARGSP